MAKRILSLILLLSLMLPIGIGFAHAFHNHDNNICLAVDENHIHQEKTDCDQLHYFNQTVSSGISTDIAKIEIYWSSSNDANYNSLFTFHPDQTDLVRGPPLFSVL